MSEPEHGNVERWRLIAEREDARAKVLAEACDTLSRQPELYHARRSVEVVAGQDFPNVPDRHQWAAEYTRRRANYLEARLQRLRETAAWRAGLAEAGRQGLERFAPGLDAALEPTRQMIEQVGGLTAEHERELGRPPRSER